MSTSKRCLVTFFHSSRTHPQILKDLSKSHDQKELKAFFFGPSSMPHGVKSRQTSGKAVTTTTHKNSKSKDFLRLSAADDRDAHTRKAVFLLKKLES
jgi:hypothetical protein